MGRVATLYADGSLRDGAAGGGYLARFGDRMTLGCFPLPKMANAMTAEAEAAFVAVDRVLDAFDDVRILDLRADNSVVAGATPVSRHCGADIHDTLARLRATCRMAGAGLQREWSRGHSGTATASGFANGIADTLASLGAEGLESTWEMPFDALWRHRAMACHPSLARENLGLSHEAAAAFLGVPPSTIDELLRHGHLSYRPQHSGIAPLGILATRAECIRMGADLKRPCLGLSPERIRGHVDEVSSGLRLHSPPRRGLRVSLATIQDYGKVGAGWVIRSDVGASTGGLLFDQGAMDVRMASLPACLVGILAHDPGFDDLVLTLQEPWTVSTLNAEVTPSDAEAVVLESLDRILLRNAAEFRAEVVRPERMPVVDRMARPAFEAARAIAQAVISGTPHESRSGRDVAGVLAGLNELAA